jgi:hypothetical protein
MLTVALVAPARAVTPANDHFFANWARYDLPVSSGEVQRTWMWGPEAITDGLPEPYDESPDHTRTVQYFDKARMEITHPDGDPGNVWYVTNGLLPVELITGQMQLGDKRFEQRAPAAVNVAGDADDSSGPTYATFEPLLLAPALPAGTTIIQRISRSGVLSDDPALEGQQVTVAYTDAATQHSVATPFTTGIASDLSARGLPITEAYWATAKVAGTPRDVLMQCFERRCLTYTPDNPEGWKVEAGNVGRHYYEWRYEPELQGRLVFGGSTTIFVDVRTGEASSIEVVDVPEVPPGTVPCVPVCEGFWGEGRLSPDGQHVVLAYEIPVECDGCGYFSFRSDLYVVDIDGANLLRLTDTAEKEGESSGWPDWSPDGSWIAYHGPLDSRLAIFLIHPDGTDRHPLSIPLDGNLLLPVWSPDGSKIAFLQRVVVDVTDEGTWVADRMHILDLDTGELRYLLECDYLCFDLACPTSACASGSTATS